MPSSYGQDFKLIDKVIFPLKGAPGFEHIATIQYGLREFMCFRRLSTLEMWVEEVTGGHLEKIEDDALWEALLQFCQSHKLLEIKTSNPFVSAREI